MFVPVKVVLFKAALLLQTILGEELLNNGTGALLSATTVTCAAEEPDAQPLEPTAIKLYVPGVFTLAVVVIEITELPGAIHEYVLAPVALPVRIVFGFAQDNVTDEADVFTLEGTATSATILTVSVPVQPLAVLVTVTT